LNPKWVVTSHWAILHLNNFKNNTTDYSSSRSYFTFNPESFFIGVWYFLGSNKTSE